MDFPISVPSIGLVDGKFADEDPLGGTPGSLIPSAWGNAVTEEIRAVILAADLVPAENENNQLELAIKQLAADVSGQATESYRGTAKVATQAQVNAGTDDATMVTPKKLRFGFLVSWGASGSIVFPTWMGGIVIQWLSSGTGQVAQGFAEVVTAPWTVAFPNACWFAMGGTGLSPNGNGFASCRVDSVTTTSVTSSIYAHITGWVTRKIYAIGN